MIVWINGPFGGGKTTLAAALAERLEGAVVFDPEHVGYLLEPVLRARHPVPDFQDWVPWRRLVGATLRELDADLDGAPIIAPQSVLRREVWDALAAELDGLDVRVVTLHSEPDELERRVRDDVLETTALDWRLDKRGDYQAAANWLGEIGDVIDTTELTREQVADEVVRLLGR